MKTYQKIVVKVGSSTLTHSTGRINIRRIGVLSRVISDLKGRGNDVVLVSSGAIAVGTAALGFSSKPEDTATKQAAAAAGQCELMNIYARFFSDYGIKTAQLLLTGDVFDNPDRRANAGSTVRRLLELGAVPIVNENDTISVKEILIGDNDTLSAMTAKLAEADLLIILTDIDGLYDGDPSKNPNARKIESVNEITPEIKALAGGAGSSRGTGGMFTKLEAAEIATEAGIDVVIACGENPEVLYDLMDGKKVGTKFAAKTS